MHLDDKVPRCDEVEPDTDQLLPFLWRPRRELDPVEQAGIGPANARRILYSPIYGNRYAVPKAVAAVDVASAAQARGARSVQKRCRGHATARFRGVSRFADERDRAKDEHDRRGDHDRGQGERTADGAPSRDPRALRRQWQVIELPPEDPFDTQLRKHSAPPREVVLRDDHRPLSLRKSREQPANLHPIEKLRDLVLRDRRPRAIESGKRQREPSRRADRDNEEPSAEICVHRRGPPQPCSEGVVQRIEGTVGIAQDGEQRAVDARELLPVQLLPTLARDRRRHH